MSIGFVADLLSYFSGIDCFKHDMQIGMKVYNPASTKDTLPVVMLCHAIL